MSAGGTNSPGYRLPFRNFGEKTFRFGGNYRKGGDDIIWDAQLRYPDLVKITDDAISDGGHRLTGSVAFWVRADYQFRAIPNVNGNCPSITLSPTTWRSSTETTFQVDGVAYGFSTNFPLKDEHRYREAESKYPGIFIIDSDAFDLNGYQIPNSRSLWIRDGYRYTCHWHPTNDEILSISVEKIPS
jgi:hypothetical protein